MVKKNVNMTIQNLYQFLGVSPFVLLLSCFVLYCHIKFISFFTIHVFDVLYCHVSILLNILCVWILF